MADQHPTTPYKIDPYVFGRTCGEGAQVLEYTLIGFCPARTVLGVPQLEAPEPVEGCVFRAPGGAGYYRPEKIRQAVDELIGRDPGARGFVATWARHGREWLRLFRLGYEHGFVRSADEEDRDTGAGLRLSLEELADTDRRLSEAQA